MSAEHGTAFQSPSANFQLSEHPLLSVSDYSMALLLHPVFYPCRRIRILIKCYISTDQTTKGRQELGEHDNSYISVYVRVLQTETRGKPC